MFPPNLPPVGIALVMAILVLSLGIHEAAHGWVALKCGDTTARDQGRITLNPVPHIDPFMTIILPLILFMTGGIIFGGARPVPVNFYNLRKPYPHMALVALAGPFSNLLIAAALVVFGKVMIDVVGTWEAGAGSWRYSPQLGPQILAGGITLNLLLAAFNLFPIPPLDGSRVMAWLLPKSLREPYHRLESFGLVLVMVCVFAVPGFRVLLFDTMQVLEGVVHGAVTLGGLW